eukprot:TRINITY_DN45429_c0_g1_i1.p1 TRINITY_DN45429_c0_g1~~TRINITY_DN45429_c0_g1_i1.p1  ORF type:complete len:491 (-),score=102.89 TRINITY_DN45429_c0_g1_i1:83-1444(-)
MAAGNDRMTQAAQLEKGARELDQAGKPREAYAEYRKALKVFEFVYKYEQNPNIKSMVRDRIEELVIRAEVLQEQLNSATTAPGAGGGGGYAADATAPRAGAGPPSGSGGGGTGATGDDEDSKEKDRLRKSLEGAIMTSKPNVKWDDVAGLKQAKDALQETVILPTKFPQLFTGKRKPFSGILLYGPPGTGKSHLARACATEADATFFSISSSDLVSKWMGESERLVRNLFEMARESKPSIIFIDEIDSLCGARGESGESDASRRIKTEFLVQMDGVGKSKESLLILGATNTPWDLDQGIRRRFEKRIYIPLPDAEARATMLKIHLGDTPSQLTDADLRHIAERAEGFSGADLSILVRDAIFEPVRRLQRAKTFRRVTRKSTVDGSEKQYWQPCSPGDPNAQEKTLMEVNSDELLEPEVMAGDFEVALEKIRPSVSPKDLLQHEEFTSQYGMEG